MSSLGVDCGRTPQDMEHEIRNFFKKVHVEPLSHAEHSHMRNEIISFMNTHPQTKRSTRRDFAAFIESWNRRAFHRAVYAATIVAIVGGGTAYAAEGALPGEVLYPIKVNVSEKVEGALALSAEAKADWNTKRLSRRLEEAESLAVVGQLSDERRAELETHINTATDELVTNTETMAQSDDDTLALASIQSNVEAALIGHEHVLESIRESRNDNDPNLARILGKVRAHAESVRIARADMEARISGRQDDRVRAAATERKNTAGSEVDDVRASAKGEFSNAPGTAAEVSASALRLEEAIEVGDEELKLGKYGEAFSTFQAAIRAARAVKVHIEAESRLGGGVEESAASSSATTTDEHADNDVSTLRIKIF